MLTSGSSANAAWQAIVRDWRGLSEGVCATRAKKWLGVIHFGKDRGPVLDAVS
jgi:hypothetical protein